MSNFKRFLEYNEVQGVLKSQDEENPCIQVFLFFENLSWGIPKLNNEPVGFKYTIDEDIRMNENEEQFHYANIVTMKYALDTDIDSMINHVVECLNHNYEIEERNAMFSKFIEVAKEKFINADIKELGNLISKFDNTSKKDVTPEQKKEGTPINKPNKNKVTIR